MGNLIYSELILAMVIIMLIIYNIIIVIHDFLSITKREIKLDTKINKPSKSLIIPVDNIKPSPSNCPLIRYKVSGDTMYFLYRITESTLRLHIVNNGHVNIDISVDAYELDYGLRITCTPNVHGVNYSNLIKEMLINTHNITPEINALFYREIDALYIGVLDNTKVAHSDIDGASYTIDKSTYEITRNGLHMDVVKIGDCASLDEVKFFIVASPVTGYVYTKDLIDMI